MKDFIRLDIVNQMSQLARIGKISMVKEQLGLGFVRILVDVLDSVGIEGAGSAYQSMYLIALMQKKFG
jgi:hypothetical protein